MHWRSLKRSWPLELLQTRRARSQPRKAGRRRLRPYLAAVERLHDRRMLAGIGHSFDELTAFSSAEPITAVFQDGLNGYTGTRDTRIRSDQPTINFGSSTKLELDGNPNQISLIRWDTIAIPVGSTVTSASITLDVVTPSLDFYEVYEGLRPWNEQRATYELAATGQPWEVPGAAGPTDHAAAVLASLTGPSIGLVTTSLNAAGVAVVQKWITDPSSNFGLVIQDLADQTTDDLDFSSSEALGLAPRLTVTYTPAPVSTTPETRDDAYSVDEDGELGVLEEEGLLINDSDPGNLLLSAVLGSGPSHGTLELESDGSFTFEPNANFHGQDTFTYNAADGAGNISPLATVTITVNSINDAPLPNNESVSTTVGVPVAVSLSATDFDGDALSYAVEVGPTHGTLTGTAPNLTYRPTSGYSGLDSFTFRVSDGTTDSTATIAIVVNAIFIEPQYDVKHPPRLQLGNAPLIGFPGSATDQVELLWQTIPAGSGTSDSFTVQYRLVGQTTWSNPKPISKINTNVEGRIIHSAVIDGLLFDRQYEYRVQHLRSTLVVATYQATFRSRLPVNNNSPFSFVAYGDSAYLPNVENFRSVQDRINLLGPQFALLLGDNIYNDATHEQSDARFDPTINPEAAQWNASHIDYLSIGNHELNRGSLGKPTEEMFSVPIPIQDQNSWSQPPLNERPEHNYSFDYGNVHFVTFDTNSEASSVRLNPLLTWVEQDLQASDAQWKIVFAHHPVAGGPDKDESPLDNYYRQVVPRLLAAGVDLFLVGHSHTYNRSYPLLGEENGEATFVLETDNVYAQGTGLVQVVNGVGGKELRNGTFSQFPFIAAGYSGSTNPRAEIGFTKVDVTPSQLTIRYIAASDGHVMDSFTITSAPSIDRPPLATNDSYAVNEDGVLSVPSSQGVLINDTDPDGDPLTAALANSPSNGSLILNSTGSFIYTPSANFHGVDTFLYRARDGITNSLVSTVTITVNSVNDPPVANNLAVTVNRNTPVAITLRGSDVDGDALGFSVHSLPSGGRLSGIALSLTYTPNAGFLGIDSFTYRVDDGFSNSTPATVTINVVDPVPVTVSLQDGLNGYQGTRDTRIRSDQPTVNFGANTKLELDGNPNQISLILWDTTGIPIASIIQSASITLNVIAPSVDSYEVYESLRAWKEKTATYQVAATDEPWEVPGAAGTTDHAAAILADVTAPSIGLVTTELNAAGIEVIQKWVMNPSSNRGFIIQDLADQTSDDLDVNSSEAIGLGPLLKVTYMLVPAPPPNAPPIANNQSTSIDEDTSRAITLTGSDTNGDLLRFLIDTGPAHGTLSGTAPNLTYTPNVNFHGVDSFRFQVNDGSADSAIATVSITVNSVNDQPTAEDLVTTTNYNAAVSIVLRGSDVDGDALSYLVASPPTSGTLTGSGPNRTYKPNAGFIGSDTFTYRAADGTSQSAVARVTINVDPISFQDGVFPTSSYNGTQDTKIRGDLPTRTSGTAARLETDGNPDIASLVKWDIRAIPTGSTVNSAAITINVLNTSIHSFNIYQALQPWVESTATFNELAAGTPWGFAGAQGPTDRGTTILGTVTAPSLGTIVIHLNNAGTAVVQNWVNVPTSNHGFVFLNYDNGSNDALEFASREGVGSSTRPKLTVDFRPASAASPSKTTMVSASSLQNPKNPYDVNDDSVVAPRDALIIVNTLNGAGANGEDGTDYRSALGYLDVSGDTVVTPIDVLLVINYLNNSPLWNAEAESVVENCFSCGAASFAVDDLFGERDAGTTLASFVVDLREVSRRHLNAISDDLFATMWPDRVD